MLDGVIRVQTIQQPNGFPQSDIWIEKRVAAGIKKGLYLTAHQRKTGTKDNYKFPLYKLQWLWHPDRCTSHWRLNVWRPWRDRLPTVQPPIVQLQYKLQDGIATVNINGMGDKRLLVQNLVMDSKIDILAIQETLLDGSSYNFYIDGYETYTRKKKIGFCGQMLLVNRCYPSYEISHGNNDCFIHVTVAKFRGSQPWHFLSVYLPSGGSMRKQRTECLHLILEEYNFILNKDPKTMVVILGDFNIEHHLLQKHIQTVKMALTCLPILGNGLTFHRRSTKLSAVDSILVNPAAA